MKTSNFFWAKFYIFTLFLTFISNVNCYSQSESYTKYFNNRFGFSFLYPNNFKFQEAPENGDGQEFLSQDDNFHIISYGGNDNYDNYKDLDTRYSEDLSHYAKITYKKLFNNFYVLSGINNGEIFYIKKYVGEICTNTIEMRYPIKYKSDYDDIVKTISNSFKAGNLSEFH